MGYMSIVHYLQALRSVAFWKLPAAVLVPLTPTDLEPGAAVGACQMGLVHQRPTAYWAAWVSSIPVAPHL